MARTPVEKRSTIVEELYIGYAFHLPPSFGRGLGGLIKLSRVMGYVKSSAILFALALHGTIGKLVASG